MNDKLDIIGVKTSEVCELTSIGKLFPVWATHIDLKISL
jgi:hypothetical protein